MAIPSLGGALLAKSLAILPCGKAATGSVHRTTPRALFTHCDSLGTCAYSSQQFPTRCWWDDFRKQHQWGCQDSLPRPGDICYLGPLSDLVPKRTCANPGYLRAAIFVHAFAVPLQHPPPLPLDPVTKDRAHPQHPLLVTFYFLSRMVVSEVFILLCFIIYVHVTYIHFEGFDTINKVSTHTNKNAIIMGMTLNLLKVFFRLACSWTSVLLIIIR